MYYPSISFLFPARVFDVVVSCSSECSSSITTSADKREISENAAFSKSISASRFSARDFICISPSKSHENARRVRRDAYCCDSITGCDELVVVIVYEGLSFAIELTYFCNENESIHSSSRFPVSQATYRSIARFPSSRALVTTLS